MKNIESIFEQNILLYLRENIEEVVEYHSRHSYHVQTTLSC